MLRLQLLCLVVLAAVYDLCVWRQYNPELPSWFATAKAPNILFLAGYYPSLDTRTPLPSASETIKRTQLDVEVRRGQVDALADLARGEYKVANRGGLTIAGFNEQNDRLLRERYGIETKWVCPCGCVVPPEVDSYVFGYNRISMPAIEQKFGPDVLEKTAKEAYLLAWGKPAGSQTPQPVATR
jgi:hypothetical protein